MTLCSRNQFTIVRPKIRTEFRDETIVKRQEFDQQLSQFLKSARRREELYCRVLAARRRNSEDIGALEQQLINYVSMVNEGSRSLSDYSGLEMPQVQKKTVAYHMCTKLIELLEGVKERLRGDHNHFQSIEEDKQNILREYKRQLDSAEFNLVELTRVMAGFRRGTAVLTEQKNQQLQPSTGSKFVLSTQILSSKQREHLIQFMKLKQREQQRKAKVEQIDKIQIKELRKKGRRLYNKVLECQDVLQDFCMTLTRQQNAQAMLAAQLQRNSIIQEQIEAYSQQYRLQSSRLTLSSNFRIKKKNTLIERKLDTIQN